MRLFFLAALVATLAPATSAQGVGYPVARGNLLIDGNASFSNSGTEGGGGRTTFVSVSPGVGYFVADGLMIGAGISINSLSGGGGGTASSFGIGPEIAYFFGRPGTTMFPHVGAGISYVTGSGDFSSLGADIFGGLLFMVARNVGINTQAFAQFASTDVGGGSTTGNSFGVRAGVTAFIGR